MRVRFLKPAQAEVDEAVAYFDQQREGLGDRFEQDLLATLQSMTDQPLAGKLISGQVRRWRFRTFHLIYIVDPEEVIVLAVAHHRRRPNYWRIRLSLLP